MKILVTGANGQLGSELRELAPAYGDHDFIFTDLPEADLCNKGVADELILKNKPSIIINCAAYTAVDKAETDSEAAYRLNRDAVAFLAASASRINAFLIHISTDYVFNGRGSKPYVESDPTAPVSVYGASKLEGEKEVLRNTRRALIIRTAWLYSSFGHNFVRTILKAGREKEQLNVVSDQLGCPTYAYDLAKALLDIIPQCAGFENPGIYHYANSGITNWYDFARAIVEMSGLRCTVNPILTKDYPTTAQRPLYSVLDTSAFREKFSLQIPFWKDSLQLCLERLGEKRN